MTDAELSARMRENLVAFKRLQGAQGAMHHLGLPGVDALALTAQPRNLHQQMVLYTSAEALAPALAPVEAFFRGHGTPAWRVSVPEADVEAARLLARSGYAPEDVVPIFGCTPEDGPVAPPGPPLERPATLEDIIALNEDAFEERMGHLYRWAARVSPEVHPLLVREQGRALAGGLSIDFGDTAGIYLVATASAARRRGFAAVLMRGLLLEAWARGRAAAVLQSTPMGVGLYRHLGLREADHWTNWVRRTE